MELHWTVLGRECVACFYLESEARECAAVVVTREWVRDVQLLDEDDEIVEASQSPPAHCSAPTLNELSDGADGVVTVAW
jgi:hypothetical protein